MRYLPEGKLIDTQTNRCALRSVSSIHEAYLSGKILEARAVTCDGNHNLLVDLGVMKGVIPREEGAIGIAEGVVRDIALISRVNKPVCFMVTSICTDETGNQVAMLSRRAAQRECYSRYICALAGGDVIPAKVTHLETFGAFCDIGCGNIALMPIDAISISRIGHPGDRFTVGDDIRAIVKCRDEQGRLSLSHKELLGTWEENAANFRQGETVSGIIRSVEDYGVFVELSPNMAGLAELHPGVRPGQHAGVFIKSMIPEKMKVKLVIINAFDADYASRPIKYYFDGNHIDRWKYSPGCSSKIVETIF